MIKNIKVVVWCLAYNQARFIRNALDGFVMQKTNFSFEVIVHDDKSTDGTTDIILEYAKRYPDIIISVIEAENQWTKGDLVRIIDIMNDKYRNAPYIAFCEGDDYWTSPYKLQKQVDFLDKEPQYSMCFHSAEKKYECDGVSWINCENIEDKDYNATEIFVNWTIPTASVVCRKEALEFYSSLKGKKNIQNYDIFVFLSCAMVGQIRGMHDKMSVYRIQETGLTYNNDALVKCTMRNPEHFICLRNNFPIVKRKYVNKTIAKCLFERACLRKERLKSSEDLVLSLYYDPLHFFVRLIKYFYHKY